MNDSLLLFAHSLPVFLPFIRSYDVEVGARAADHAGHVVQHCVALALVLEQLHVGVEQVSLGDMDALPCSIQYTVYNIQYM